MKKLVGEDGGWNAANFDGVRRAALEIATTRAQELRMIKQVLLDGDQKSALSLMYKFFGIPKPQMASDHDEQPSATRNCAN